eukprot:3646_1
MAANAKLTGKIFIKTSPEFKNSKHFGQIFKSMDNWNKKQWSKIYAKINKICNSKKSPAKNVASVQESKPEITEYSEETKMIEHETDYIDNETDMHLIHQFCSLTNATKKIAISFLDITEWN